MKKRNQQIPSLPVLVEEMGEPFSADASFSLEEPDELVQISAKTGKRKCKNDSHTGQVAAASDHISATYANDFHPPVNKKIGPRTMIDKIHRLSSSDLLRSLHTRILSSQA